MRFLFALALLIALAAATCLTPATSTGMKVQGTQYDKNEVLAMDNSGALSSKGLSSDYTIQNDGTIVLDGAALTVTHCLNLADADVSASSKVRGSGNIGCKLFKNLSDMHLDAGHATRSTAKTCVLMLADDTIDCLNVIGCTRRKL